MRNMMILTLALTSLLQGCQRLPVSTPFKILEPPAGQATPEELVVVITYAEIKDNSESASLFNKYLDKVAENIDNQPGLYGYSLRKELLGNKAWTMTAWDHEQSIAAFRNSPFHLPAVSEAPTVLKMARFARIEINNSDLPLSWDYALRLLAERGRVYDYSDTVSNHVEILENAD